MGASVVGPQSGGQQLTVDDPASDRAKLPPRLRPGTSTVIEGVKVLNTLHRKSALRYEIRLLPSHRCKLLLEFSGAGKRSNVLKS